jgi:CRP/FNR family transcriptional regulator, cyclic AMP receptor protein
VERRRQKSASERQPLFEVDPSLAASVASEHRELAHRALMAEVVELPTGNWSPRDFASNGAATYLLGTGLMLRRVALLGAHSIEPLGPGDLVRPSQEDAVSFVQAQLTVAVPARLAILDDQLLGRAVRVPGLFEALVDRATRRSRFMAVSAAIDGIVGVRRRLHALMWTLAERWGEVRDGGILVPLDLSHSDLAGLVAARRPSVTTALAELEREGALERTAKGWILHGHPPEPAAGPAG